MKKIFTIIAFVTLALPVFAQSQVGIRPWHEHSKGQFNTQSLDVNTTNTSLNVLYLNDGLSNNYTALAYPIFKITGLGNRVGIYGVGSASMNDRNTKIYVGSAIGVNLIKNGGWDVTAYGGLKGINLTDRSSLQLGKGAWVFGVGLSIPFSN